MIHSASFLRRLGFLCLLLAATVACQVAAVETTAQDGLHGLTPVASKPIPPTPEPTSTEAPVPSAVSALQARHERVFKYVWTAVERYYVYPDYNGVDWKAARKAFAPRIAAAPDDETFWQLMRELIELLNDEHSVYLSPEEVAQEDRAMQGDLNYVGIGVYVTLDVDDAYGVVLFPLPDSPAEAAGLRPHERILSINGMPVCCTAGGGDRLDLMLGESETRVALEVQYPGELPRHIEVTRKRIETQLPVMTRRISVGDQTAGYILVPTLWDETIAERVREALVALLMDPSSDEMDGLVLDLRINGGGAYTELYDLLSLFVSGEVGSFHRRGDAVENLVVEADPIANSQTLPLVVLIGRETASYAEVLSGVLQDLGRAQLVGQPTLGNLETVYGYDLEDGSRLWLAEETFESRSGQRWEGEGVSPDVAVLGDWGDFTMDNDPQLDVALDLMLKTD